MGLCVTDALKCRKVITVDISGVFLQTNGLKGQLPGYIDFEMMAEIMFEINFHANDYIMNGYDQCTLNKMINIMNNSHRKNILLSSGSGFTGAHTTETTFEPQKF